MKHLLPSLQVRLWYFGDAVKPRNESARCGKWAIQMIDQAMSESTSLSIVVVLVGGTVDLSEFRASDSGLLDSTLHPHLTRMNEVFKQNNGSPPSQFITEKCKKTARSSQKRIVGS
jgi:hypothetical protein